MKKSASQTRFSYVCNKCGKEIPIHTVKEITPPDLITERIVYVVRCKCNGTPILKIIQ